VRNAPSELERFLDDLVREARPGDRLPTIRELMRRFGASQMLVQRAFQSLKARGLIASQVGRGTYFQADGKPGVASAGPREASGAGPRAGAPTGARSGAQSSAHSGLQAPAVRSILLLRRSISIARGRMVVEGLQRRFTAEGHRVLEVSYTDPDHARTVLKGLQRFDACVVQSSYKTITIGLLAALRERSDVLAVDGAALVGTDVDAVGMEWGVPLTAAIELLRQRGHTRIAYATTSHPFLASQLGRRSFDHLKGTLAGVELQAIPVPHLPDDENYEAGLVDRIEAGMDRSGSPPFTALVAWGVEDGAKFRKLLADVGVHIPSSLSVVLLGHTDLANEHADFFDMIGCSVADQVESLHQAITARWADPSMAYGVRLIPVARRAGESMAPAAQAGRPQPGRAARRRGG
jgi:DNA-binding LacI/PurR family transcriptional regulator